MPTATFFRLPEEKRKRLIEACWTEVSRVRFTDVSINRIITAAHIPRGSFYQYFEDKEDLIRYLLGDTRKYFITLLRDILTEADGDLFALPLRAFDRFITAKGETDPMLALFIRMLRLNKGIDLQNFIGGSGSCEFLPEPIWEAVDPGKLRRSGREYAEHIFHLGCGVLASAIVETLCQPDQMPKIRQMLQERMDVLRYGGASDRYKEEHA